VGKLNPTKLAGILERLPRTDCPDLLVGMDTMDDAGVYRITPDVALVQSVDFFYPVVNDARAFGQIVAANSLSDLWAMGARALTAMNILAYPAGKIPVEVVEELLTGGSEKLAEAGVSLVGGHTMEQEELVYGMSVTGVVHPAEVVTNARARVGDAILLTKPLGTGVFANALVADALPPGHYEAFVASMSRLNLYAARVLGGFAVRALTDVTGFGLLGHALPLGRNAGVCLEIEAGRVPLLPDVLDLMAEHFPHQVCKSRTYVQPHLVVGEGVDPRHLPLFCDAQTSGGLLALVPPDRAGEAIAALREGGDPAAAMIGTVISAPPPREGKAVHLRLVP
jgi:selenide,water dikinase